MFVFTVCQVGAESALKKEIAFEHPNLRFAYSRPGFLTFKYAPIVVIKDAKEQAIDPSFELRSIFARAYGLSLGKATEPAVVLDFAQKLRSDLGEIEAHSPDIPKKFRLHVWERDAYAPDEEPKGFVPGAVRDEALGILRKHPDFGKFFHEAESPDLRDLVIDLIFIEPGSWWVGYHQHTPRHSRFSGGKPSIVLPAEAPSRAYLKLEEAVLWSGAPLNKDDIAVEIGSAPGGASYALLKRGLRVIGIDPAEMASVVLGFGADQFIHIAKPAALVQRDELPESVEWILLDMNVAPNISLNTVERIAPAFEESLLGVILTLKINEWKFADEIPKLLRRVEKLEMIRIRATQLASNKQEICVVGLTRKGAARKRQ